MKHAAYDFETDSVNFVFDFHGAELRGRISQEALQDHFGARHGGPALVDDYRANAGVIDARACERYAADGVSPVVLMSRDF